MGRGVQTRVAIVTRHSYAEARFLNPFSGGVYYGALELDGRGRDLAATTVDMLAYFIRWRLSSFGGGTGPFLNDDNTV